MTPGTSRRLVSMALPALLLACGRPVVPGPSPGADALAAFVGDATPEAGDPSTPTPGRIHQLLDDETMAAFDRLLDAKHFDASDDGTRADLRRVMAHEYGPEAIDTLFEHGSAAARVHALAAYWYWYPDTFQGLRAEAAIRHGDEALVVASGGKRQRTTLKAFLRPVPRATQLPPGSTLAQLRCRRTPILLADVAGGGHLVTAVEGDVDRCDEGRPAYLEERDQ